MRSAETLPVFATAGQAYALLWHNRLLHAGAIWPPVLFLVAAEFLYHRIIGNADGVAGYLNAVLAASWYMSAGALLAWLTGLKFLISFSISWRRHLILGERFDPFFFKAPFWRYLGFTMLTSTWVSLLIIAALIPAGLLAAGHAMMAAKLAAITLGLPAAAFALWATLRQVPFFTVLTLDLPIPRWRSCTGAMRGTVTRYLGAFVLAMLPLLAIDYLLDLGLKAAGANFHSVPVALGESAVREALVFLHFSLGASIGAITTMTVLPQARARLSDAHAAELLQS